MERLHDRVAVVTGGANGIGLAMCERFGREGMRVVVADVRPAALDTAVLELRERGLEVTGVVTDVSKRESVDTLRDRTLETYGAVHVVCNNAGIGAGAEGRIWEHEENDWRWALDVNVWGVINGINAFVPHMLEQGDEGHIVNTSSGNGGISPIPGTPQYAVTKAAVVTLTECLWAQLREVAAPIGASVLFPGPHMLRTGLFESWRNRPPELARSTPRRTPPITLEQYEQLMRDSGTEVQYTPVDEVAERVIHAIRSGEFWILPPSEQTDDQIRGRAESMLKRDDPAYLLERPL